MNPGSIGFATNGNYVALTGCLNEFLDRQEGANTAEIGLVVSSRTELEATIGVLCHRLRTGRWLIQHARFTLCNDQLVSML